jgi:D-serine deaminase-like pyridoxal phosphate-dependent protein
VLHSRFVKKIHDLPTPCLVLDLDRFESNLDKMSRFAKDRGVALRPHAKSHKCVDIAKRQVARGAIGVCAATIAEAEVMTRATCGTSMNCNALLPLPLFGSAFSSIWISAKTERVYDRSNQRCSWLNGFRNPRT